MDLTLDLFAGHFFNVDLYFTEYHLWVIPPAIILGYSPFGIALFVGVALVISFLCYFRLLQFCAFALPALFLCFFMSQASEMRSSREYLMV